MIGFRKWLLGCLLVLFLSHPAQADWVLGNSLGTARDGHTTTVMPNGLVLTVGGRDIEPSVEIYDPKDGTWSLGPALSEERGGHTATLLLTGEVLIVGGEGSSPRFPDASLLFDPVSRAWRPTGSLEFARTEHTATLLHDGRVLVTGGRRFGAFESNVELYDPETGGWTVISSLQEARHLHAATRLETGEVLITGGENNGGVISLTEIFDPSDGLSGSWTTAEPLFEARYEHTASLLRDGQILVAGGRNLERDPIGSVEIFDPATSSWSMGGPGLQIPRGRHVSLTLPGGEILVIGGDDGDELGSCEIRDPETGLWSAGPALEGPRWGHTANMLPEGNLLVAGGFNGGATGSSEILSRLELSTQSAGRLVEARTSFSLSTLADGSVLLAGGLARSAPTGTTEIYDPASNAWTTALPMPARAWHTATLMPSGNVLVAGGRDHTFDFVRPFQVFLTELGEWVSRLDRDLREERSHHTATLLPNGKVLFVGGLGRDGDTTFSSEILDSEQSASRRLPELEAGRVGHTATLLQDGRVLVAGGDDRMAEIFDPADEQWSPSGSMNVARSSHTATLLPSGEVLLAGGSNGVSLASSEIYDPSTGHFREVGDLQNSRARHDAHLLPSGQVLVVGGAILGDQTIPLSIMEIFDPKTERWASVGNLREPRSRAHMTSTMDGQLLVASSDTFSLTADLLMLQQGALAWPRPRVHNVQSPLRYGAPLRLWGTNLRAVSESSDGRTQQGTSELPWIQLQAWDGSLHPFIPASAFPVLDGGTHRLIAERLPSTLHPGPHWLRVFSNGVASEPWKVDVVCGFEIVEQPASQTVDRGETATFRVGAPGARRFQWLRDGERIPGATGSSYTTPPVDVAESGTRYRVLTDSACEQQLSETAVLSVRDEEPPRVEVLRPNGGERWALAGPGEGRSELISWSMADDVRICQVRIGLLVSTDGVVFEPAAPTAALPMELGPGGACSADDEVTTQEIFYPLPERPPGGQAGAFYKIEVEAIDHAGSRGRDESEEPFFFVDAEASVKTLIFWHPDRLQSSTGASDSNISAVSALLGNLAAHPRVQGEVADLSLVESLQALYAVWDANIGSPHAANAVLFAPGGLRDYLQDLRGTFPEVEYVMLIGGDDVVPMARMVDRTSYPESRYVETGEDLTATGSRLARALAADYYPSDDPLVAFGVTEVPLGFEARENGGFLPDLAVGRLVERPDEILASINSFLASGGVLDLETLRSTQEHGVLVTGYDFLIDSGRRICRQWERFFASPGSCRTPDGPADGELLTEDWQSSNVGERRSRMLEKLQGRAGNPFPILNLNGHATHYQLGVPGDLGFDDIQGLNVDEVYGPHPCGSAPGVDLTGSLVYAVGCHAGLSVPGSCLTDADHSLDLPQTFLARGVLALIANSGYGWGLIRGVGYSERLVELFTRELLSGPTVVLGQAVGAAKQQYFLELPRFDPFDEKTLLQWTFYGFPMAVVKTGLESSSNSSSLQSGTAGPTVECDGDDDGPAHLDRKCVIYEFSSSSYEKFDSQGEPVVGQEGCPDLEEEGGCYYTLNGQADVDGGSTGTADLPIQPFFSADSALSGKSQHGVLWRGGKYLEESGWRPLVAELVSNEASFTDHGVSPRLVRPKPRSLRRPLDDEQACRSVDESKKIVVVTGEALRESVDSPEITRQRIYRTVDLEVFYFDDGGLGGNCDRVGPAFGAPPFDEKYHRIIGESLEWAVPAQDPGGVWRVVLVIDQGAVEGVGRWEPIELEDSDGDGIWRGYRPLPGASELTYVLQAVDARGNVSWIDFEPQVLPASQIPYDLPLPEDLTRSSPRFHPADQDTEWRIDIREATAYAAAWKREDGWSHAPFEIPIDYVTLSSVLWLRGELYDFDSTRNPPWRPQVSDATTPAKVEVSPTRTFLQLDRVKSMWEISIEVGASADGSSYAVEETVAQGWKVEEVFEDGKVNGDGRTVRWGPFFDGRARTLTYRARGAGVPRIEAGVLSVDGQSFEVKSVRGPSR